MLSQIKQLNPAIQELLKWQFSRYLRAIMKKPESDWDMIQEDIESGKTSPRPFEEKVEN